MQEKRDQIRRAREDHKDLPYWSTMPPRYAEYEIRKAEKMEQVRIAAEEAERQMHNMKLSNEYPANFDWKGYFKSKQDEFREELDRRKAELRAQLHESQAKPFSLSVGRGTHNVSFELTTRKTTLTRLLRSLLESGLIPRKLARAGRRSQASGPR